jgi:surface polysaccharide O-acyltransferase-like enzyme
LTLSDRTVGTMDTTRDPAIDAYRAMALAAVVLGHWLLTVTWWSNGRLEAHNLLDVAPWTQWATWALQPVPLFFVVGGWAGA